MGGGDEIIAVDSQVVDGRDRHAVLQRRPVLAVIEGDEYAELGAGVQQAAAHRVLAHHVDDRARRQAGGDR